MHMGGLGQGHTTQTMTNTHPQSRAAWRVTRAQGSRAAIPAVTAATGVGATKGGSKGTLAAAAVMVGRHPLLRLGRVNYYKARIWT